jgi:TolB-like protein/Flp pilus assembly protein TadD
MNQRNFFAELKRRNVYKVAVAYAVVAWLLIQAASILFPTFEAPTWVMKIFVAVIVLGFPLALVLSWAFEITPEGIKLESEVAANQSISRRTGRRIVGITIALAVIAAGLMIFQILRPKSAPIASAAAPSAMSSPAALQIESKSIAVLPFDNLSHDPENAYFSEGIQDEILTRLAKIAQLKVVSRTSTQKYKTAPDNLRDIAHQLGVANILEGSVQKAGDQVRVTVQLINAISDAHLWADTYDRKLTDIFSVESDIARTVAETLRAKLTGSAEQILASKPTENPEAHQLYLKGRYFWNRRGAENLIKAINYFQQAIDKDPTYALAYAGLGDAHAILPIYAGSPAKDDVPKALVAARKAVELDDSLSEAHTCLANAMVMNVQLAASEPEFHKAIELNPNYATAHQWFGECLQGEGRFNEALAELKRAQELDPLSLIINGSYGTCLGMAGRSDEAIDQLHKTMEMDPTFTVAHVMLGQMLEDKGALSEAIAEYEKAMERYRTPATEAMLAHAYVLTGRKAEAHKILDDLTNASQQHYVAAYPLAIVHLALGDKDEALRLLEKSFEQRCLLLQGHFGSLKTDRRLDPLRGDPRFQKLLERFLSGQPK